MGPYLLAVSNELILKSLQCVDAAHRWSWKSCDIPSLLTETCSLLRLGHMDIMKEQKHLGLVTGDERIWMDLGRRIRGEAAGKSIKSVAFALPLAG